jgi:hypothetical protein
LQTTPLADLQVISIFAYRPGLIRYSNNSLLRRESLPGIVLLNRMLLLEIWAY